jgi:hypothetical protein
MQGLTSSARAPLAALALGAAAWACGEPARPVVQPVVLPSATAAAPGPSAPIASASAAPEAPEAPARAPELFDRGAAVSALSAVSLTHCLSPSTPNLSGAVILVFSPSGAVTSAKVEGPHAGAAAGACVAAAYSAARVPAFDGPPMVVRRSFHAP